MGIFNFNKNKQSDTTNAYRFDNTSNSTNKYKPLNIENLNKYKIEYLKRLDGKRKSDYLSEHWDNVLISRTNCKLELIKKDFLKKADAKESLQYLIIPDLKNILKTNNLKVSGKKQELIDRILLNLEEDVINQFINEPIYVLSKKGLFVVNKYDEMLKNIYESHTQIAYDLIKKYDFPKAFEEVYNYYDFIDVNIYTFNPPKVKKKFDENFYKLYKQISALKLKDLNNTPEFKKLLKIALLYSYMYYDGISDSRTILNFISRFTTEKLQCKELDEFVKNNEFYLKNHSLYKDNEHLYIHTVCSTIHNNLQLEKFKNNKFIRKTTKGITILNSDKECSICSRLNPNTPWKKIKKIPSLPAHYGCRCMYILWEK